MKNLSIVMAFFSAILGGFAFANENYLMAMLMIVCLFLNVNTYSIALKSEKEDVE